MVVLLPRPFVPPLLLLLPTSPPLRMLPPEVSSSSEGGHATRGSANARATSEESGTSRESPPSALPSRRREVAERLRPGVTSSKMTRSGHRERCRCNWRWRQRASGTYFSPLSCVAKAPGHGGAVAAAAPNEYAPLAACAAASHARPWPRQYDALRRYGALARRASKDEREAAPPPIGTAGVLVPVAGDGRRRRRHVRTRARPPS